MLAYLWRVKMLYEGQPSTLHASLTSVGVPHIFFDEAVMSREALMTRSRLSWCSSSSLRKVSNIGMNGD